MELGRQLKIFCFMIIAIFVQAQQGNDAKYKFENYDVNMDILSYTRYDNSSNQHSGTINNARNYAFDVYIDKSTPFFLGIDAPTIMEFVQRERVLFLLDQPTIIQNQNYLTRKNIQLYISNPHRYPKKTIIIGVPYSVPSNPPQFGVTVRKQKIIYLDGQTKEWPGGYGSLYAPIDNNFYFHNLDNGKNSQGPTQEILNAAVKSIKVNTTFSYDNGKRSSRMDVYFGSDPSAVASAE